MPKTDSNRFPVLFAVLLATTAAGPAAVTPPTAPAPAVPPAPAVAAAPAPVPAPAPAPVSAPAPAPVPVSAPAPAAVLSPLPLASVKALAGIVEDPAPPALVRDQHYIISNESRHDLFKPAAENRGGVFIGVGSDQNYILAAWAKPELLVLFDFDQLVVNVHRVYRAFFLNAATPAEFMELWNVKNEARAEAIVAAEYPDPTQRAAVVRAYRVARYAVPRRFRLVLTQYKQRNMHSFLDDEQQYQYIVQLFRTGRVVMVRGDLTAGTCMTSIATAVRAMGSTVRVLYLSNAERYFNYTDPFRSSMLALPTDERSIVLRTRARRDGSYEYIEQEASNFNAWVNRRSIHISFQYTHLREPLSGSKHAKGAETEEELYTIRRLPGT